MTDAEKAGDSPDRRQKRRLKTRAQLLDATLRLILKKGIDKTTMDAITETADLGRRTLYYHFSNKEECILAAVAGAFEKHASRAEMSADAPSDPAQVVATHSRLVLSGLLEDPVAKRMVDSPKLLATALDESVSQFALRDIYNGVEQGRFRLPMSERLLDRVLIWALTGLLIENAESDVDREELVSAYTIMVLTNLGLSYDEAVAADREAARMLMERKKL